MKETLSRARCCSAFLSQASDYAAIRQCRCGVCRCFGCMVGLDAAACERAEGSLDTLKHNRNTDTSRSTLTGDCCLVASQSNCASAA